ncbi:MAG: TlyA family rRNA (cytidine-2'-O)-methyltransferase [Anaerolineales bacterium]|nr:TlyA family RNA methyltransferase [Anaerolineae bacterium]PWB56375.1 MAG: TlyA family rRNA (cytidine-2'-O)-methyltransferase [Anaerolineales bacterium]
MPMGKSRLDVLLVERGLAESRSLAQRLVMAGQVRVDGQVVLRAAASVQADAILEIDQGPRFVSRGGEKLAAALQAFPIQVKGKLCADVGASTGGFTDCLLQHGALRVYAIDVGHGILDWKLRQDPRVVVMEDTNARFVEVLPEPVQLVTVDVSFISLKIILPVVMSWLATDGQGGTVISLVKPQFEAGRHEVARGKGVIRDPLLHRQVLLDVLGSTIPLGYALHGLIRSPITGPKGNVEFLAWLEYPAEQQVSIESLVDTLFEAQN